MNTFIELNNKRTHFLDLGTGFPIVLLHGYMESIEIWGEFAQELSNNFRVICIDIPGHGKSDELGQKHSIEQLTKVTFDLLNKLNIVKCFMIGHSMGGYIALMFQKLFPEKLLGFSLFHSHPFADSEETKKKRIREIQFVNEGKKDLIATFNIPNAFANENINSFQNDIEKVKKIALKTSENGIIATLNAMINRPDLSVELEETKIPFLFILGKKDNYIDYDTIIQKIKLPINSELHLLENSGHMGFIEEKKTSIKIIYQFINTLSYD